MATTTKECMVRSSHHRFILSDSDSDSHLWSGSSMEEVSARQVLNKESETTGSEEVGRASVAFVKPISGLDRRRRKIVWEASRGLSTIQVFSQNGTLFVNKRFHDPPLINCENRYRCCNHLPNVDRRSTKWTRRRRWRWTV